MTHATDCGIHCRCLESCCLQPGRDPRWASCVCQTCWLNTDQVPPSKALSRPVKPSHTTQRHLPSLDALRFESPDGDGFCPRCVRTMPLNRLVGGDVDLVLPLHVKSSGSSRMHCPGSSKPPADITPDSIDNRIYDLQSSAAEKTVAQAVADALTAAFGVQADQAGIEVDDDEMTGMA